MASAWSAFTTSSPCRASPSKLQWETVTSRSASRPTGHPGRHDVAIRAVASSIAATENAKTGPAATVVVGAATVVVVAATVVVVAPLSSWSWCLSARSLPSGPGRGPAAPARQDPPVGPSTQR
jgi:hypothetical protein